jgi:hypothetical protein
MVYRLFDYEYDFKWRNFELQSYRSRRKLQFSYKVYLHPSSNKKLKNFENSLDRSRYSTARAPNAVGHHGANV